MSTPWIQCTSVSNECLGGCRSMREHDAYRHATLTRERDEARADAAQKGEALKLTEEALAIHVMADAASGLGADAGDDLAIVEARRALADTTSEAWLAEVRAQARDEALEEAALNFESRVETFRSGTWAGSLVRALKRGGK